MSTAEVTPAVLSWAREQVALSPQEAAEKIGVSVDRLLSWEQGQTSPTWTALIAMSSLYKRPLATFFLPSPPEGAQLPTDYRLRTVDGNPPQLTRDLIVAIRQARAWQSVITRLGKHDPELLRPVRVPEAQLSLDPESIANPTRTLLNISYEDQLRWKNPDRALLAWRERIEELGVLVFAMRLKRDVCRGFSMWLAAGPPVIGLASEAPQARTFTLLHEFAHLMLRINGICSEFEDESERGKVERFCNRLAANILMPRDLIFMVLREHGVNPQDIRYWTYKDVKKLADDLSLSVPAIALRLDELGLTRGIYDQILLGQAIDYSRTQGGGGGAKSWPGVRVSERGSYYSAVIYDAWRRGLLSRGDAAHVMAMKPKYVDVIGEAITRRRQRLA